MLAPNQIASIAASLIPFLEHDDANRALDGIKHDASGSTIIGQDLKLQLLEQVWKEELLADSQILIVAEGDGVVEFVDAEDHNYSTIRR
jgi:DNA-directed RNA polymerase subunit beta